MTAHVLYSKLDATYCGTLSCKINQALLRDQLGFEGVLFSDDLFMKGIAADPSAIPAAATQSLLAGCDMLLLCHDEVVQRETITQLKRELKKSEALSEALSTSAPRVHKLLSQVERSEGKARASSDPERLGELLAALNPGS
jgi:beta-N-acetylhexosaminidase